MNGLLGSKLLVAGTYQSIYIGSTSEGGVVTLNLCNRGNTSALVRVAITATANTPLDTEWIEYDVTLLAKGVLERSGIVVGSNQYLTVMASTNYVTAQCWGVENGIDLTVPSIPVSYGPVWTSAATLTTITTLAVSVQLTATDTNTASLTYSLVNGSLPAGITISSTGLISGTVVPAVGVVINKDWIFTARVSDGNSFVDREFTLPLNIAFDGSTEALAAKSAYAIKVATSTTTNGLYWITMSGGVARQVYCDMSTDGGGWMRIYNGNNTTGVQLGGQTAMSGNPATGRGKYSDADINYLIQNATHNTALHTEKVLRMRVSTAYDYFIAPKTTVWNSNVSRTKPLYADGWNTYAEFTAAPNVVTSTNGANLSGDYAYTVVGSYSTWGQQIMSSMSSTRDSFFWSSVGDTNDADIYLR